MIIIVLLKYKTKIVHNNVHQEGFVKIYNVNVRIIILGKYYNNFRDRC